MADLTIEIATSPQPGARLPQALSENRNAENAPLPVQLKAARNKIARLEDMDHQLRGELQRVVGQRDDWSARSSRLEKEVDNLHAQLTLLEAETHLPSSPMASPRSSECGAVVHRMSVERRNMQGELLRLQRRDEVQTELLEELRAQLLAATEARAGSQPILQPAEASAQVAHLQRQEAALRAELSKAEFASARQAAQLLELQGTAEQHARTAAELAQAQGALKAQLSKQDATASAAAARVDEMEAQMHEEQAGAAEQRAILQQLQRHLRGPAGTGTQEGADQQTLAAEVTALVHQQQEESQQQLAAQSAAAAEQAAQFETALKQQAAAAASAAKLEEQTATLEALRKQQEQQQQEQQQQEQQQATAKLEAQLEKEKAERQAAAGALAKLEAQLSDRASEQQAAAASAAELHVHLEKEAEHQAVVAALKESLSHYKAAAQLAHERVLDLEEQRAAADKQWQERLASEQASSQQHHLRVGRMEADLHCARQRLHQVEQRWSAGGSSPGATQAALTPMSGGSCPVPTTPASPAATVVDKPFSRGTHATPEGNPASASCVGLSGLRQSSSEGAGPFRENQLHRQVDAETKARKRAESCSAEHAASSAKLHLECIALTRSNKQLNVDNQRLELQLLAARRTPATATEQHQVAQVGDGASRHLLDLAQGGGSARKEPGGSMQQRSGSVTSSPCTHPPHARTRTDSDSVHSLQLGTPTSSDRERPTTPSSSASSEQARLRGSNPGSHQGTARVLHLTSDGAARLAKGSSNEATQEIDAGATSPDASTASAGDIWDNRAAAQGNDGLQKESTLLQSRLAEVQGELRSCRQELHSQGEAAQEQVRRLEQRSLKLEVKLSKARQQAENRAAEVSAAQMVSVELQSKLEDMVKSQQGTEKQGTKLRVQVVQMTAELQAAESQLQASHQQLASLRRSRSSQQGQNSSFCMYSQAMISVLLGIAAILLVNYLHA